MAGLYIALVGVNSTLGSDAPTLTVTVLVVTDCICSLFEYGYCPTPGNLCSVLLPSIPQVNTNDSGLM